MTNIDQLALDAATAAIDPKVLIGPRCQVKARIQVIIAEAIRVRALEDSEAYQGILQAEQEKREALDQDLAACRDYANDQAAIFALLAKALGVPAEPHQGMAERVLEASRALTAHIEALKGYIRNEPEADDLLNRLDKWCLDSPATSLARLKAQWQAESLEEEANDISADSTLFADSSMFEGAQRAVGSMRTTAAELRRQAEASKAGEAAAARGASAYRAGAGVSDNPYLHDAAPHPGEMANEWQRDWDSARRQSEGLTATLACRDDEQFRQGFWWGFERARCHPDQMNILAEFEDVQELRRRQAQRTAKPEGGSQ